MQDWSYLKGSSRTTRQQYLPDYPTSNAIGTLWRNNLRHRQRWAAIRNGLYGSCSEFEAASAASGTCRPARIYSSPSWKIGASGVAVPGSNIWQHLQARQHVILRSASVSTRQLQSQPQHQPRKNPGKHIIHHNPHAALDPPIQPADRPRLPHVEQAKQYEAEREHPPMEAAGG